MWPIWPWRIVAFHGETKVSLAEGVEHFFFKIKYMYQWKSLQSYTETGSRSEFLGTKSYLIEVLQQPLRPLLPMTLLDLSMTFI